MKDKRGNLAQQIKLTFENLIKIYSESSQLLQDASALLEEKGYNCLHGNTLGTEQSKNINFPARWLTPYGARYFKSDEESKNLLGIGIIYIGRNNTPILPLLLIGVFIMKPGKEMNYAYWFLRHTWYHLQDKYELGEQYKIDTGLEDYDFKSAIIMGKDLTDVKNPNDIEKEIIQPLMSMLIE